MAKADMFLRLEGKSTGFIKGESFVAEHLDEIEILGWDWGMTGSTALGGAGAAVKTALSEIRVTKMTDRATTQIMSVMRSNEILKKVVLTVRKAGVTPPVDYLVITLQNGRLTKHTIGTKTEGAPELVEQLSIAFEEIEVAYAPQSTKGAKLAVSTFTARVHTN